MRFTLNEKRRAILKELGYQDEDMKQIENVIKVCNTKYKMNGKPISRDEVIAILGERSYLAGIGRSAFHYTSVQVSPDKSQCIFFDSEKYFK